MAHVWIIETKSGSNWMRCPSWYPTRAWARHKERQLTQDSHGWDHYRVAKYVRVGRSEGKP